MVCYTPMLNSWFWLGLQSSQVKFIAWQISLFYLLLLSSILTCTVPHLSMGFIVPDKTTGSPLFNPDRKEEIGSDSNLQQTPLGIQLFYTAVAASDPGLCIYLLWYHFLCLFFVHSRHLQEIWIVFQKTQLRLAFLGGFCIGVGVGAGLFSQWCNDDDFFLLASFLSTCPSSKFIPSVQI